MTLTEEELHKTADGIHRQNIVLESQLKMNRWLLLQIAKDIDRLARMPQEKKKQ